MRAFPVPWHDDTISGMIPLFQPETENTNP
jgi:hypothetical protein